MKEQQEPAHWGVAVVLAVLLPVAAAGGTRTPPLVQAVKDGNEKAVAVLLQQHTDVNAPESDGTTALHWAAYRGDARIVEQLLQRGARAAVANRFGVRPLSLAVETGDARTVELLLSAGADANTVSSGGETALMTAARAGRTAAVRVLLDRGANVNAREGTRGQTALMWAAAEGHADVVRALVARGADVRAVSRPPSSDPHVTDGEVALNASGGKRVAPRIDVFTPLQFAVQAGQVEAVQALLESGADIGDETPQGMNTLVLAIANAHYELAALLLEKGADPNAASTGFTPLHQVVRMRTLSIGQFPQPIPTGRVTSLDLAKELLARGVDVDARNTKGFTDGYRFSPVNFNPFLMAAKGGDIQMMRLLVAHGANPFAMTPGGATALMLAAGVEMGNANEDSGTNPEALVTTEFALQLGFDVNAVNNSGDAPLHGAVWRGSPELVELLAKHGARLDLKNGAGVSALQMANGECILVPRGQGPRGSLCSSLGVMVWRRPQVIPALRALMTARGLALEMAAEADVFSAGARIQGR